MGNKSSTISNNSSKKQNYFCCPCKLSKTLSSSSLSNDEKYLPTFDRIVSNGKISSPSPIIETNPSNLTITHDENNKSLSSTNNRRSLSLTNVIITVSDQKDKELIHSKPPLPPGKSITVSKLPPIGRSFRGTLGNTKRSYYSQSIEHARLSIEDLEKSLHGASSIDQWIDSLPILGTPSLNRNKTGHSTRTVQSTNNKKIKRSLTAGDESNDNVLNISYKQENEISNELTSDLSTNDFPNILKLKINREYFNLANKIQLNIYLKDFRLRMNQTNMRKTFKNHFSLSNIIYPFSGIDQTLADDLNLHVTIPLESILPNLSSNLHSSYKIHEQVRSMCYFIPSTDCKIDVDDDEYKRKHIELDRTHFVVTLDNKTKENDETTSTAAKNIPMEQDSSFLFISNDSFHIGLIRIINDNSNKQFLPFIFNSTDDNHSYLSSNLIQQWFNTLMYVNQTCSTAKRFLKGDGSHITCMIKQQAKDTNSLVKDNNLMFAALRLPPYMHTHDTSQMNSDDNKSQIIDAFSSTFLSDNKKSLNDTIHIDYEQYSFALLLQRWPKSILDNYYRKSIRNTNRKWPSKYHLNIIIKRPIILIPILNNHQWKINFDLIEQSLFELMNESALYFYALCQQIFCQTLTQRICIKHCFLNYCEKYGVPFSTNRDHKTENISELMAHFINEIGLEIKENFIRHYFDHNINLIDSNENYNQWFDYINKSFHDHMYLSSTLITKSNRSIIIEFLFHFIDQLYQTFHIKRSQFHLNEIVLIDLHKQLCEKLSNDTNNNSTSLQTCINDLLNNQEILERIQMTLAYDFEPNAELVHTCLNQVRKADSSLIFHYTWTIYVQYLHTYYNVLWNI